MRHLLLLFIVSCGSSHATSESLVTVPLPAKIECPQGTVYNGVGCAEPIGTTVEPTPTTPKATPMIAVAGIDEARDTRFLRGARSVQLVVTELQALEQLLTATSPSSPDRPALLRRIAEEYFELYYIQPTSAHGSLSSAIARYTELENSHPTYAQIDEVLYYHAYAFELSNDLTSARKVYYELIMKHPSSKKIPHAYYAFGEMFRHESAKDPSKWDLAVQSFKESVKYPNSDVTPWAWLRLGQSYDGKGDAMQAKMAYAKLRTDFPASKAAQQAP